MFGLSPVEIMIVGAVAVLLFGSRLPSVARSLGKSMTEFKKGLHGIEDEVNTASRPGRVTNYAPSDDRDEATAPKFEPPTSEPSAANSGTVEPTNENTVGA
jgi:sec-independent protein translocase protein TatA